MSLALRALQVISKVLPSPDLVRQYQANGFIAGQAHDDCIALTASYQQRRGAAHPGDLGIQLACVQLSRIGAKRAVAFFGLVLHASYDLLAACARAGLVLRHSRLSAAMRQLDAEYHALVAPQDDGRDFTMLTSLVASATPPPANIVGHAAPYSDFPSRLAKLGADGQNDDGTQREGDPAAARLAGNLVAALEEAEDMDKIV